MKYLVDANVLSEPTKPQPADVVVDWLAEHGGAIAVNPIIVGELEYGILRLAQGRRRKRLQEWFEIGVRNLPILALDGETARVWAALLRDLHRKGRAMPVKDSLVAATAIQHDLTVVTRNVGDYRQSGVAIVNPFES